MCQILSDSILGKRTFYLLKRFPLPNTNHRYQRPQNRIHLTWCVPESLFLRERPYHGKPLSGTILHKWQCSMLYSRCLMMCRVMAYSQSESMQSIELQTGYKTDGDSGRFVEILSSFFFLAMRFCSRVLGQMRLRQINKSILSMTSCSFGINFTTRADD